MSDSGSITRFRSFSDPLFRGLDKDRPGEITNKFTDSIVRYSDEDEFVCADVTREEEEIEANYRKEKLRAELLMASAGDPEAIRRIYKNTAPQVNGVTIMTPDYIAEMNDKIKDAIKAEARTMRLDDLKKYVKEFPELQPWLSAREWKFDRLRMTTNSSQ